MSIPRSLPVRCGIAVLSGVAYALAFPPLGWCWLVVPGIAGLLVALRGLRGGAARRLGFLHGMVVYGVGLPWLCILFGAVAVGLWGVLAAFTAAFAWMQCRAKDRGLAGGKLAAFTVVNWCGWEFIRAELFPLKFPWMTPGLALGPNMLVSWIGVYGVSSLVVLVAVFLVWRRWKLAVLNLLLLAAMVEFRGALPEPAADDPRAIRMAGLQFESVSIDHFHDTTRRLPPGIQHVVWPEYAVPYDVRASRRDWAALQGLCKERGIALTLGTQTRSQDGSGWHNTALTLDATGVLGEHHKVHTVHFFDDGIPGKTALPVQTSMAKAGSIICFDGDYEGIVRRMTAAGAEVFLVPLMDAESWSAWQHDQHAELFRIRACENARWLFVCSTSGVSQVIDAKGAVHAKLGAMEQGVFTGAVRRETRLSIYTRFGWLTPWCMLSAAAVCWIALLLPPRAAKDAAS